MSTRVFYRANIASRMDNETGAASGIFMCLLRMHVYTRLLQTRAKEVELFDLAKSCRHPHNCHAHAV